MAAAVARGPDIEMANLSSRPAEKAGREILYTRLGILLTCGATAVVVISMVNLFREHFHTGATRLWFEDALFLMTLQVFAYGNMVYLASRFGYFKRLQLHRPATRDELECVYDREARSVAVLIPSYREELRVIRQTIISAALMEYPGKRITLLIDDPPEPPDSPTREHLCATRRLPQEIEAMFRGMEERYARQLADFETRCSLGAIDPKHESDALAALYREVAAWLESQAAEYEVIDHTDVLYLRRVLREPARAHRSRAHEMEASAASGSLDVHRIRHEYRRLASLFAVRITSFERKRFDNLSHTLNKAMNL
ncbi:MAG TPA: hypothetical protein VEU51_04195, partial [Candidatus Acidoferrales bacterium]|nr:hypothetical protein [Candidatus Acidoferrales bacterium]